MSTLTIVNELKQKQQDFEWYPTTDEIIQRVKKSLGSDFNGSILDIGAGDGRVLKALPSGEKYAIEKSKRLIELMDKDIFIIGTDFYEQTLIDKRVDVIFCNPPYSEYELWTKKIISESNSNIVFLVIPKRWKNKPEFLSLIEKRKATYRVIGDYDFENAERQARAQVQLIKISFEKRYYNSDIESDPFEIWFNEHFKINADKEKEHDFEIHQSRREQLKALINGDTLISSLIEFYRLDIDKLINTYKSLETLGPGLLKELNITIKGVKEALKVKISGLKNLYWQELFDHLDVITCRLTSGSRKKMLDVLTSHTNVDFTVSNAYSIVIWAIKNANKYMDEQLKEIYMQISDQDNIRKYKSNKKLIEDGWRYCKKDMTHYSLDYRIVHKTYGTFSGYYFEIIGGISKHCYELIGDIMTIARNLGFNVINNLRCIEWHPGKREEFECDDGELFCDIKAYKNGNLHFRFRPEFMKRFNIEAARLNGWIKEPKEAAEEFDISAIEAEEYFGTNYQICANNVKLLS